VVFRTLRHKTAPEQWLEDYDEVKLDVPQTAAIALSLSVVG
jgi:hypothetical protein